MSAFGRSARPSNHSSLSLFDLRVGSFEPDSADAELVGYYPAALFSKKVFVVPEVLGRGLMPPISLEHQPYYKEYIQFMPKAFDCEYTLDSTFNLGPVELLRDAPLHAYTFCFHLDMLTGRDNQFLADFVRFNVATLWYMSEDPDSKLHNLFSISIDIAFKSETRVQVGPNQLHLGRLKLIVNHLAQNAPSQESVAEFAVVQSPSSGSAELVNRPNAMYQTRYQSGLGMSSLLSAQMLVVKVAVGCGVLIAVYFGHDKRTGRVLDQPGVRQPARPGGVVLRCRSGLGQVGEAGSLVQKKTESKKFHPV